MVEPPGGHALRGGSRSRLACSLPRLNRRPGGRPGVTSERADAGACSMAANIPDFGWSASLRRVARGGRSERTWMRHRRNYSGHPADAATRENWIIRPTSRTLGTIRAGTCINFTNAKKRNSETLYISTRRHNRNIMHAERPRAFARPGRTRALAHRAIVRRRSTQQANTRRALAHINDG